MSGFPRAGETFGRYRILEQIGAGAMGVVFRAQQIGLDRDIALKVLSPVYASDEDLRDRFVREARILARIESPHIIGIHDFGEIDGCLFIATPLVPDGDLQGLLAASPPPLDVALDLTAQVVQAVASAHAEGVVHRDIKPANVLIRRRPDDALHAYLGDFGIARRDDEAATQVGRVIGTYGYMSPERCHGEIATPASDIYSLGCLLVATITGTAPYQGSELDVAQAHVSAPIPQWTETQPVMAQLNAILRRSMAKDPHQRYGRAEEMLRELEAARFGLNNPTSGSPHPDSTVQRVLPAAPAPSPARPSGLSGPGRSKRPLVLGTVAVLALVTLGAIAWQVTRGDTSSAADEPKSTKTPTAEAAPASPTSTPTPTTCWNGTRVTGTPCPAITGVAGMRYLFPEMTKQSCQPKPASSWAAYERTSKVAIEVCEAQARGGPITLVYSEWRQQPTALQHYRAKYSSAGLPESGAVRFGPLRRTRSWEEAVVSQGAPFSVTVATDSEARARDGARLVRWRTVPTTEGTS